MNKPMLRGSEVLDSTSSPKGTLYDRQFWAIGRHEAIADAAEAFLSDAARDQLHRVGQAIGGNSIGLVDLAAWADLVKRRKPTADDDDDTREFLLDDRNAKADTWHYVNIPVDATGYSRTKYPEFTRNDDAVQILAETVRVLQRKSDRFSELSALRLLVHLVGDVHQPVHIGCGFFLESVGKTTLVHDPLVIAQKHLRSDRGGNQILLPLGNRGLSLHSYWDGRLGGDVDLQEMSDAELEAALAATRDGGVADTGAGISAEETEPTVSPEIRRQTVEKLVGLVARDVPPSGAAAEGMADTTPVDEWGTQWATDALIASRSAYQSSQRCRPAGRQRCDEVLREVGRRAKYEERCAPIVVEQMKLAVRHLADLLNAIWR